MLNINKKVFAVVFLITASLLVVYSLGSDFLQQKEEEKRLFLESVFQDKEEEFVDSNNGMISEDINGLNSGIINYSSGKEQ